MPKSTKEEKEKIITQRKLNTAQFSVKCLPDSLRKMISDGYHTFAELYAHRIALFIALSRFAQEHSQYIAWRSRLHADGTGYPGWFVAGIGLARGSQITYHLPEANWSDMEFAETLERAPEFDGHTSADVLERLKSFYA
jgi:hypothetical protein